MGRIQVAGSVLSPADEKIVLRIFLYHLSMNIAIAFLRNHIRNPAFLRFKIIPERVRTELLVALGVFRSSFPVPETVLTAFGMKFLPGHVNTDIIRLQMQVLIINRSFTIQMNCLLLQIGDDGILRMVFDLRPETVILREHRITGNAQRINCGNTVRLLPDGCIAEGSVRT